MSTPEVILNAQEGSDTLLADTAGLRTLIRGIGEAKRLARLADGAEIDDLQNCPYTSFIAGRYVPFVSAMSVYTRQAISLLPGTAEKNISVQIDAGNANFIGDLMIQVEIPQIALADLDFSPLWPIWPAEGYGQIRYCQFPGIRLFEEVSLVYNGVVSETYTWENVIEMMQHEMDENKRIAFEKCVGQQQMRGGPMSWSFDSEGAPVAPGVQLWQFYTDGPQTPKNVQGPLTLCIPIMFTVFRDESIAIPNSLDANKRELRIKMTNLNNVVSHYNDAPVGTLKSTFQISAATLYTRCIYMNPQIASLFTARKKTLVRSWKTIRVLSNLPGLVSRTLDELKNPVEAMYARFVPQENLVAATSMAADNVSTYDYYYVAARVTKKLQKQSFIGVASDTTMFQNMLVMQMPSFTSPVLSIGLTVGETEFFAGRMSAVAAGPYLSFVESSVLRQPVHHGAFVFNFAQSYRGDRSRTASGYIDMARLGNKRLNWETNVVSADYPVYLLLSIRSLNVFEPRDDGTTSYAFQV